MRTHARTAYFFLLVFFVRARSPRTARAVMMVLPGLRFSVLFPQLSRWCRALCVYAVFIYVCFARRAGGRRVRPRVQRGANFLPEPARVFCICFIPLDLVFMVPLYCQVPDVGLAAPDMPSGDVDASLSAPDMPSGDVDASVSVPDMPSVDVKTPKKSLFGKFLKKKSSKANVEVKLP